MAGACTRGTSRLGGGMFLMTRGCILATRLIWKNGLQHQGIGQPHWTKSRQSTRKRSNCDQTTKHTFNLVPQKITDFVSINGNSESPCSDRGGTKNYDREDNWEHLCSFVFVVNSSGVQSTPGSALQYYYFNAPRLDDATPFAGEFVARLRNQISVRLISGRITI